MGGRTGTTAGRALGGAERSESAAASSARAVGAHDLLWGWHERRGAWVGLAGKPHRKVGKFNIPWRMGRPVNVCRISATPSGRNLHTLRAPRKQGDATRGEPGPAISQRLNPRPNPTSKPQVQTHVLMRGRPGVGCSAPGYAGDDRRVEPAGWTIGKKPRPAEASPLRSARTKIAGPYRTKAWRPWPDRHRPHW